MKAKCWSSRFSVRRDKLKFEFQLKRARTRNTAPGPEPAPASHTHFRKGGAGFQLREGEFAFGIDQAADNHRQSAPDPRFGAGIEESIQANILGELEERGTGSILSGVEDLKRLGRAPWVDVITESGLHQAELGESNVGDTAVGRVTDLRTDAVGGAEDAVVSTPPGLDSR